VLEAASGQDRPQQTSSNQLFLGVSCGKLLNHRSHAIGAATGVGQAQIPTRPLHADFLIFLSTF
jgi:hypothetical protein